MKTFKFLFAILIMGSLALTSCQSEGDAKSDESAEAAVSSNESAVKSVNPANTPATDAAPTGPTTSISFEETNFDFGEITDGEKVRHTFSFTNTGNEPLIISNCKGSCGCTVPQCPKDPIAPGEGGEITVEYNSRGKSKNAPPEGKVDTKFVNVTANTAPAATRLTIKATVKPDPNAPAPAETESK